MRHFAPLGPEGVHPCGTNSVETREGWAEFGKEHS